MHTGFDALKCIIKVVAYSLQQCQDHMIHMKDLTHFGTS